MTGHLTGSAGLLPHQGVCESAIHASLSKGSVSPALMNQLRRELGAELAAFVVTQVKLQSKARKKLQPPDEPDRVWWCTDRSLQQSTPWQVAKLKANWFGDQPVHDLCCGIGGDACHIAARGPLVAVDADPLVAELAAMNLGLEHSGTQMLGGHSKGPGAIGRANDWAAIGIEDRRVLCCDATSLRIPVNHWIHIDPDRRPASKRTSCPDHYLPDWSCVVRLVRKQPGAVIKLAPAAVPDLADSMGSHRCWISLAGTVREQSLLCGETRQIVGLPLGGRSAVVIRASGEASWFTTEAERNEVSTRSVGKPLEWLVDPDAAIRAAGLTEAFCVAHGMSLVGRPSGFLTCSDVPSVSALARCSRVLWSGSCDDRKLRRELRNRQVYPLTVKVRGTDHEPQTLIRRYRKCGDQPIQLWIGRGGDRVFAAITECDASVQRMTH